MEHSMKLHNDLNAFKDAIEATSTKLNILPEFIEKDYWISLVLMCLAKSEYVNFVVFKGGTSLSKGYKIVNRFSEDVDIAVIGAHSSSGNKIKSLIRAVEKEIACDLSEVIIDNVTSKGSRFRKSVYRYPDLKRKNALKSITNSIIIEINSFANPYPYAKQSIQCMIGEMLNSNTKTAPLIEKYGLGSFEVNVLDKNQTLIEKVVSLIRYSFDDNPTNSIASKIRHFYDLYFLFQIDECRSYVESDSFLKDMNALIDHDKALFNEPKGWKQAKIRTSPLLSDFDKLWEKLKSIYTSELSMLAFTPIPKQDEISDSFKCLISRLNQL